MTGTHTLSGHLLRPNGSPAWAIRILGEFEAAQDAIAPEGAVRGLPRVAAPPSGGPRLVAPVLAELARRHPLLHVHAAYSDRFVDLISEGFDAGIRAGFLPDSSLVARRIRPISGMLVASPGYIAAHGAPQTLAELADHECLLQGTEPWRFVDGGKTITVHPRGRFKADNGEALLSAALAGLGVAALPDFLIEPHIAAGDGLGIGRIVLLSLQIGLHVLRREQPHIMATCNLAQ